jgi:hypothetical protein
VEGEQGHSLHFSVGPQKALKPLISQTGRFINIKDLQVLVFRDDVRHVPVEATGWSLIESANHRRPFESARCKVFRSFRR